MGRAVSAGKPLDAGAGMSRCGAIAAILIAHYVLVLLAFYDFQRREDRLCFFTEFDFV